MPFWEHADSENGFLGGQKRSKNGMKIIDVPQQNQKKCQRKKTKQVKNTKKQLSVFPPLASGTSPYPGGLKTRPQLAGLKQSIAMPRPEQPPAVEGEQLGEEEGIAAHLPGVLRQNAERDAWQTDCSVCGNSMCH